MNTEGQVVMGLIEHDPYKPITAETVSHRAVSHLDSSPQARVVYFIESADMREPAVKVMNQLSEEGLLPSDIYKTGIYLNMTGSLPDPSELGELQFANPFLISQMQLADKLSLRYPGRFKIATEFEPDEYVDSMNDENGNQIIGQYADSAVTMALRGDFNGGVKNLEVWVEYIHKWEPGRNARIAEQIKDLATDGNTLVIASIGASHSPAWHMLRHAGIKTEVIFEPKTNGQFWFDHLTYLVRKWDFKGMAPSEFDYRKALAHAVILEGINAIRGSVGKSTDRNIGIKMAYYLGQSLGDMETVRQFEKSVQTNGPVAATGYLNRSLRR